VKFDGLMYATPKIMKNAKMSSLATTRKLFMRADWRMPKKLSIVKAIQRMAAIQLAGKVGSRAVR